MRPRIGPVRHRLRLLLEPFWVVPAAWSVAAVVVGLTLPEVETAGGNPLPLLFQGGVDSARSVLSTTAGAMISVTGLVFSITIVVLQLASSQFSPRVLGTFLESRVTQHTLGVFVASFLYSLAVLRSIVDTGAGEAPALSVSLSFVLVLGSVAMFLAFIHHITRSISVTTIIHRVGEESRSLIERSEQRNAELPAVAPDLPALDGQSVVVAHRTGYLDGVDVARLCHAASSHDARVELLLPLGAFVPEGGPLALIAGPAEHDWAAAVRAAVTLRHERTMEQDLTFGFRRLVDIAERALSPGVNDPTTAVQAVDEMHDLLRRLGRLEPVIGVHADAEGVPRVLTREVPFEQYLDLAVDEVDHYGRDGLQVPARLEALLTDLEAACLPAYQDCVRAKQARLDRASLS